MMMIKMVMVMIRTLLYCLLGLMVVRCLAKLNLFWKSKCAKLTLSIHNIPIYVVCRIGQNLRAFWEDQTACGGKNSNFKDWGEVFIGDFGDNDDGQNQSQDIFVASRWSFASIVVEMMMMFKKIKDKAKL